MKKNIPKLTEEYLAINNNKIKINLNFKIKNLN